MIVTRHGNCVVCNQRVRERRSFSETVDVFNPRERGVSRDVVRQLTDWKKEDIYCEDHKQCELERKQLSGAPSEQQTGLAL